MMLVLLSVTSMEAGKKDTKGTPDIRFDETVHDFGQVPEKGGNVSHDFYFTNTGDAPLAIVTVSAQCGCTTPKFSEKPVAPGKRGKITLTYSPNQRPGEFSKNAYVRTNIKGKNKKVTLKINGFVIPAKKNGK